MSELFLTSYRLRELAVQQEHVRTCTRLASTSQSGANQLVGCAQVTLVRLSLDITVELSLTIRVPHVQ